MTHSCSVFLSPAGNFQGYGVGWSVVYNGNDPEFEPHDGYVNRRGGVVVRAFASQSVDLRFISQLESYQKTWKMVFAAFLLGAQHIRIVWRTSRQACLSKGLNGMPSFSCFRQVVGPSSLHVVVAQSNKRLANRA